MAGSSPAILFPRGGDTDTQLMNYIPSFWTCIVSGESAGNSATSHLIIAAVFTIREEQTPEFHHCSGVIICLASRRKRNFRTSQW